MSELHTETKSAVAACLQVRVQPSTAAVSVTLLAFATDRHAAVRRAVTSPVLGAQQQTRRTLLQRSTDTTDGRTDTRPLRRSCFAFYASSVRIKNSKRGCNYYCCMYGPQSAFTGSKLCSQMVDGKRRRSHSDDRLMLGDRCMCEIFRLYLLVHGMSWNNGHNTTLYRNALRMNRAVLLDLWHYTVSVMFVVTVITVLG